MKTKNLFLLFAIVISTISFSQNYSSLESSSLIENQSSENYSIFDSINIDDLTEEINLNPLENKTITVNYLEEQNTLQELVFANTMLALGAGLGFGEDETLWCLHAAYYLRLALYAKSALYASFGAVYNGSTINDFNVNIIDLQLKLLMFSSISKLNEIRLIYGLLGGYGFGSEKFDGYTTDITRITLAAVIGLQLMLATNWSLSLQTNLLAYQSRTFKPENGSEFKDNFTNVLINKNNIISLSLLFNLGRR